MTRCPVSVTAERFLVMAVSERAQDWDNGDGYEAK